MFVAKSAEQRGSWSPAEAGQRREGFESHISAKNDIVAEGEEI